MYRVIRRAVDQWQMDESADNPSRPYGDRVILAEGGAHAGLAAAAIEMDARNCLLCDTERARWAIESDDPDDAAALADDMATLAVEPADVGDWLERNGEDRRLAD